MSINHALNTGVNPVQMSSDAILYCCSGFVLTDSNSAVRGARSPDLHAAGAERAQELPRDALPGALRHREGDLEACFD